MDRPIVYSGQVPLETDLLLTNKNTMVALGSLMQAVLGSSVCVDGLACTPNTPAALNVLVGAGSIYSLQNIDGTAYGTVPADTTNQTVKQGLVFGSTTLSCPAPATTGQSVVYLVQVAYQDVDGGGTVLPYYNANKPDTPWNGPNNSGVSQNTVRKGVCLVAVKTGTPATTGSQTTPAPDAGYTGLYAVTVANGQTTITSSNIVQLATAPFIAAKLPNLLTLIQQDGVNYALDNSGAANTIAVALSPTPTLTDGMPVRVKVKNTNNGATVMSINGGSNIACVTTSGGAFAANTVIANGIYTFVYDANGNRLQLQGFTAATATGLIPANNLSDVASASASLANLAGAPLASPALTGVPTAPTASAGTNTTQLATTAFVQTAVTNTAAVQSSFKNLSVSWASNTTLTVTADQMTLQTAARVPYLANSVSLTLNSATSGANGLDTGSMASNTWYYVYVIYNGTTVSGLLSASSTSPTMPGGYTYKSGPVGAVLTDGGGNFIGFRQKGRKVQPLVGSNLSSLPQVCTGAQGTYGSAYTSVSMTSIVPTSLCSLVKFLYSSSAANNYGMAVSPNSSYGHAGVSMTNTPFFGSPYGGVAAATPFEMMLESTSIYVESQSNTTLMVQGWELNI